MPRTTLVAGLVAALLAVVGAIAVPASASADGAGCHSRIVRTTGDVVSGWYDQVDISQTSRWTNCTSHTHPEEVAIAFQFRSADAERDWKNDSDDYITYHCAVLSDERTVASWSGRLSYGDRADGWNVPAAKMFYANHPRTVCTGKVVEDWHRDWTFRSAARAI